MSLFYFYFTCMKIKKIGPGVHMPSQKIRTSGNALNVGLQTADKAVEF